MSKLKPFPRPAVQDSPALSLTHRPRRNRKTEWARRLVSENKLTADDLIWPIFLVEGDTVRQPVVSMPGVERLGLSEAVRDEQGSEALNPRNLVCAAVRAIKAAVPHVGLITDVALDPYTSHGHDGVLRGDTILNDETVAVLARQAVLQAEAGADIIAPSDMMDGRVGAIRQALDEAGFEQVQIMAYAAKFASAFYGPF